MKKAEAQKLIGQTVEAWTAANGTYLGELLEVLPTSPWRAKVRVTSVLAAATHFEKGRVCRRGLRPGDVLEVGHSSVKLAPDKVGVDYLTALQWDLESHRNWLARDPEGAYAWVHEGAIKALQVVMDAERERLRTGEWALLRTEA